MSLTLLNLEQPGRKSTALVASADLESLPPLTDARAWDQLIGVRTASGQTVTPEKAKRCAAVLACMRGISEDLAALPLKVYKRSPNGDEENYDHPVYRLLNIAPNGVHTPMELRERMIIDMMTIGGFFNLIYEDPDAPGTIGAVWPLQAAYVTRQALDMRWTFSDPLTGISGGFTSDNIWRGTIMSANGVDGSGLTFLAREAIGLLLAAEDQGARLFSQGVQTDLTLSSADTMDEEQKVQLRAAFMQRHAGSGSAWMPLLLEGGMTATRIGLTAQESQYIEARNFQIKDIASVFRYPEVLLGSANTSKASTYASAEQFFQSYVKYTLGPWATRIEQTIHRDLLSPKEQAKYFVRHDFSALVKGDTAARYASYTSGIAAGFLSPAGVRRKEGETYVEGLDYYTRPLNTTATAGGDAGKIQQTNASPSPDQGNEKNSLADRVAAHILNKEQAAILGKKQDAELFYAHFGDFVSSVTGAPLAAVDAYLDMRRNTADRFSSEAKTVATGMLVVLTKG